MTCLRIAAACVALLLGAAAASARQATLMVRLEAGESTLVKLRY